jgi:hypothetical protein
VLERYPAALKILGSGVLGGIAMAVGLLLLSLIVPVNQRSLHIGIGLAVAFFTLLGLIAAGRYILWVSRRKSP